MNRNFKNHSFSLISPLLPYIKYGNDYYICNICKVYMKYHLGYENSFLNDDDLYKMFVNITDLYYMKESVTCEEFQIKKLLE